jgi:hypothetical protein
VVSDARLDVMGDGAEAASGGFGNAVGIAARIVRTGLDRSRRQLLRRVGHEFARIVGDGLGRVDQRVGLGNGGHHCPIEPAEPPGLVDVRETAHSIKVGCAPDQQAHPRQESHRTDYPNEPTARAMTSNDVSRAAVASMPIRILARLESGIVSVGLKALEFVVDT